jgi:hypothetical protein
MVFSESHRHSSVLDCSLLALAWCPAVVSVCYACCDLVGGRLIASWSRGFHTTPGFDGGSQPTPLLFLGGGWLDEKPTPLEKPPLLFLWRVARLHWWWCLSAKERHLAGVFVGNSGTTRVIAQPVDPTGAGCERETGRWIGNNLLRDSFVTHVYVSDRLKHALAEHKGHRPQTAERVYNRMPGCGKEKARTRFGFAAGARGFRLWRYGIGRCSSV